MNYLAVIAIVTASDLALIPTALSADGLQINKPASAGPVGALTLKRNDTPNYLTGIGHVQAYNTVVVRSQVEGQILRVDFKEGQAVHKGDLLAQVDPRPFQAKLDGAVANRTRDQAQLAIASENVQGDLPLLFKRICGIIIDRSADPAFGPAEVAVEAGISLRYLQKLFTARNSSCTHSINLARLNHAARLLHRRALLNTSQPVSEIAYASGFSNYTHFARQFRRRFGHPPGAHPLIR
jgi:multidrug efflux pump subunit AcrA (membrane-fusion protein)